MVGWVVVIEGLVVLVLVDDVLVEVELVLEVDEVVVPPLQGPWDKLNCPGQLA